MAEHAHRKPSRFYLPLLLMVLLAAAVFAAFALARHQRLNSSAYDLAIKGQVIWNTYRGDWFASSMEVDHYLGDHVQLIFLLLAPFYALWQDVGVLLVVQAALLALGAIPVYRIAARWLAGQPLALLFAAVYLLFPLIGFVNRFDFHPVVFTIPFFLAAYDLLETDHPWWATLFILLILSLREETGLTVFAFGFYAAVFMGRRRLGAAWATAGLIWSLTAVFVIIPTFRGGASDTVGRYGWLGDSLPAMVQTAVTRPGLILNHLLQPFRLATLVKLLLPLGFLALLAPAPLLVTLPALAYNLLSETPSQSSIYFQYLAPAVAFIFIAAIQGAARVQRRLRPRQATAVIVACLAVGTAVAWTLDNPFTQVIDAPYFPVYALEPVSDADAFREAAALLPPEAPVATMMAYAPHLALRPELHLFYDRLKLEQRPFGFPQSDYLLLNLTDLRWGVNARFFYHAIETAIGRFGYEALYFHNDVVLLAPTAAPQPATGALLQRVIDLLEAGGKFAPAAPETLTWMGRQWLVDGLPADATPLPAAFANGVRLLGYEAPVESQPGRPLCATLYWTADAPPTADATVFFHLVAADGFVQAQRDSAPAFAFYPLTQWQPGDVVADMRCVQAPPGLAPGRYTLRTGLYDPAGGARLPLANGGDAVTLGDVAITPNPDK